MNLLFALLALSVGCVMGQGQCQGYMDSCGYESFGGTKNSYRLHVERVPWDTANEVCKLEGAHLVIIDSESEGHLVNLLFGRIPFFSPPMAWGFDLLHVGITDNAQEGKWLTVQGEPASVQGSKKWRAGEPNNWGGPENCGAIDRSGAFCDIKCNDNIAYLCPFVCEKEIPDDELIDIRVHKIIKENKK